MYKVASDKKQRVLHHGSLRDWVHGEEKLSLDEQLDLARSGIRVLDARIQATSDPATKKELGLQKLQMQDELSKMKKLCGRINVAKQGFEHIFIEQAKEILLHSQFNAIFVSAHREWERRQSDLGGLQKEAGELVK